LVAVRLARRHSRADALHGCEHVSPAVDDAERGRSEPAAHDAHDAADLHLHVHQLSFGLDDLLAGQQSAEHRPAVYDQPHAAAGQTLRRRLRMDHVEAEGDTLEEAIAKALKILGVDRDAAAIEILSPPRKGLLGIGAKKARVRAALKGPGAEDEGEAEARGAREPRQRMADPADVAAAEKKARAALAEILRLMGFDAT